MRLIDADALYKSFEEVYEHPDSMFIDAAWWFFGKLEDAPTIPPPPNDPLTLEELRTMDGEPVYLIDKDEPITKEWVIWDKGWTSNWFEDAKNYGKTWIAYRQKLEEGTP